MTKRLVTFRLDEEMLARFDESARRRNLSRTAAVERLMSRQVEADQSASVEPRFKG